MADIQQHRRRFRWALVCLYLVMGFWTVLWLGAFILTVWVQYLPRNERPWVLVLLLTPAWLLFLQTVPIALGGLVVAIYSWIKSRAKVSTNT